MEIPAAAVGISFIASTFSFSFVSMKSHRASIALLNISAMSTKPVGCHDEKEINPLVWKKADQEHKQRK